MQNNRQSTASNGNEALGGRKRANINKQTFHYDEMVMASNGTRYYIKYLDKDSGNKSMTNGSVQQSNLPSNIGSTTITRHTVQVPATGNSKNNSMVQTRIQRPPNGSIQLVSNVNRRPAPVLQMNAGLKRKAEDSPTFILRCDVCKLQFNKRGDLTLHMRTHTEAMATCPCGRRFASRQFMMNHQQQRLQTEGVSCESEANKSNTDKQSESAREILRRGLPGLKPAAVSSSSEANDIQTTENQDKLIVDWIKDKYIQQSKLNLITQARSINNFYF